MKISRSRTTLARRDGEMEGWIVEIEIGRRVFSFGAVKRIRFEPHATADHYADSAFSPDPFGIDQ